MSGHPVCRSRRTRASTGLSSRSLPSPSGGGGCDRYRCPVGVANSTSPRATEAQNPGSPDLVMSVAQSPGVPVVVRPPPGRGSRGRYAGSVRRSRAPALLVTQPHQVGQRRREAPSPCSIATSSPVDGCAYSRRTQARPVVVRRRATPDGTGPYQPPAPPRRSPQQGRVGHHEVHHDRHIVSLGLPGHPGHQSVGHDLSAAPSSRRRRVRSAARVSAANTATP